MSLKRGGDQTARTYGDFWRARGSGVFWIADQAGYRVGALLALLAARLGATPHSLTLLTLMVGVAGPLLVASNLFNSGVEAGILAATLFGSYWLDCADGVLARATNQMSSFGTIFDKIVDFVVALFALAALGLSALGQPGPLVGTSWQPHVFVLSLLAKPAFSILSWLKDSQLHKLDHSRTLPSPRSAVAKAKRLVGNLLDDVPWRLGIVISWGIGCYWEFTLIFSALLTIVFLGYGMATKREMDGIDRRA